MSNDEQMSVDERRKYLKKMQKRYRKSSRTEKSKLLDEMEKITELHRKSLVRLMKGNLERKPRQKQRGRVYGRDVVVALNLISEAMDDICAERLQPYLVKMGQQLARHGEMSLTAELEEKLNNISVATVRRLLKEQPRQQVRLPRKPPERANRLAREIPAGRIAWQEAEPGHFEVDLVHHCGPSTSGHYLHSLQMIDVATGWSERVAVLGRSFLVMRDGFERIRARLPFPVEEIHPDNGSEFLNDLLVDYWGQAFKGVELSRSRAWQKNDNRFVEQKNYTLIRAYLGFDRLDTVDQTLLLNRLYDKMWLFYNFFQPVLRLQEKHILPADGRRSRIKRKFDTARTPFDRLCDTDVLSADSRADLSAMRDATNPLSLRREIDSLLHLLFRLPCAPDGGSQDVYLTLFNQPVSTKGDGLPGNIFN